jgi:predicted  nucleic acid-binding Zn-ribbon protein
MRPIAITDEHHGEGDTAPHRAKELADRVEQVLGHAGPLQDQAHECEERHRQQRVVVHDAVDAFGVRLQERPEEPDLLR